ncbi:hypothetical protein R1sor_001610 [Riccia sorocarpa]|uniref:Uncharacterized protein n=1 Tax=Riccia sorocarpa TaxID=122646 RepID=A0ABD3GXA4_9MARC
MAFCADELLKALTLLLDEQRRQSEEWRREELEYEKLSLAFEKVKKKCGWFDGYYVSRYVVEYSSAMREFDVSEVETINNFEFLTESYIRQDVLEVKREFGGSWKAYKQALRRRFWRNDFDADGCGVDEEADTNTSALVAAPVDVKKIADNADSAASVDELIGILAEVSENSDATSGVKEISASIGSFLERFAVTTGVHEVLVEVQVHKDDVIVVEAEESSVVASGIAAEAKEGFAAKTEAVSGTDAGEGSDFVAEVDESFVVDTERSCATDTGGSFATAVGDDTEEGSATHIGEGTEFAADTEGDSATDVREGFAFTAEAEGFVADTGGDSDTDAGEGSDFAAEAEEGFVVDTEEGSITDTEENSDFTTEAEGFIADAEECSSTDAGESSDLADVEVEGVCTTGVLAVGVGGGSTSVVAVEADSVARVKGVFEVLAADLTIATIGDNKVTQYTVQRLPFLTTGGGEEDLHQFAIPVLLYQTAARRFRPSREDSRSFPLNNVMSMDECAAALKADSNTMQKIISFFEKGFNEVLSEHKLSDQFGLTFKKRAKLTEILKIAEAEAKKKTTKRRKLDPGNVPDLEFVFETRLKFFYHRMSGKKEGKMESPWFFFPYVGKYILKLTMLCLSFIRLGAYKR